MSRNMSWVGDCRTRGRGYAYLSGGQPNGRRSPVVSRLEVPQPALIPVREVRPALLAATGLSRRQLHMVITVAGHASGVPEGRVKALFLLAFSPTDSCPDPGGIQARHIITTPEVKTYSPVRFTVNCSVCGRLPLGRLPYQRQMAALNFGSHHVAGMRELAAKDAYQHWLEARAA